MEFRWNNESKGRMPWHGRAWLRVLQWWFNFEWVLLSFRCALGAEFDRHDEGVTLTFAVPGLSLYLRFSPPWESKVRKLLPEDPRECRVAVHSWTIWVNLWSKVNESCSADPWWVRGVSFDLADFFLGRIRYSKEEIKPPPVRIVIDLDGFHYHGTASFYRSTWKRPRWFATVIESVYIDMDQGHGLPYSGKGENSWDCGDDALYSWGHEGLSTAEAIGHGITTVLKRREQYGRPSKFGPMLPEASI